MCVRLNGKNSYGGFVGFRRYLFVVENGQLMYQANDGRTTEDFMVSEACPLVRYAPSES